MDYIIKKTDYSTNGQFTIKPYTTNGPALPTQSVPLDEHAVSANTSLILLGKGMYDYGDIIASNFVHLLENFASPIEPAYPIQGQLWFNNSSGELFIYNAGSFTNNSLVINNQLATNLNVNNKRIVNMSTPVDNTDATNKQYVDATIISTVSSYVLKAGDTLNLNANLTLNGGEILGLPTVPSGNTAAASKLYVDTITSQYLPTVGGTVTGNLTMSADTHIYLPTPTGGFTLGGEVVNRSYVDTAITNASGFVHLTGDTITGTTTFDVSGFALTGINIGSHTFSITGDQVSKFVTNSKFGVTLYNMTPAYVTVSYNDIPIVSPTTALSLAAGSYDVDIAIDGGVATTYTVVATGTDNMTTMAALLDAAIPGASVSSVGSAFIITSNAIGSSSSIVITEPSSGTNPDLFAELDISLTATHNITTTGPQAIHQVFTTSFASFSPPTTTITVFEAIPAGATTGAITAMPGMVAINNTLTHLDGDFIISGIHIIDIGGNKLLNIGAPISDHDATTKEYVDAAVTAAFSAASDGTLASVTFVDGTLTFTSTIGAPIAVDNIAAIGHTHTTDDVVYNANTNTNSNSLIRDTLALTSPTYPAVKLSEALSTIDLILQNFTQPSSRYIHHIAYDTVSVFVQPTLNDLPINAITTGVLGTIEIVGDYTTTFLPGVNFKVINNSGISDTVFRTISTVFAAGNTTITVAYIDPAATLSGDIEEIYGALGLTGTAITRYGSDSTINLSGNTNIPSNGDYLIDSINVNTNGTITFLYADSSTPFPTATGSNGNVLSYELLVLESFEVESNHLSICKNGIKQYNNTRGTARIFLPSGSGIDSTELPSGSYSFDISVDGSPNETITINVSYSPIPVISGDVSTNVWTITGTPTLNQFTPFTIYDNVGGGNGTYTVKSTTVVGSNTEIEVFENIIGTPTASGNFRIEYTYDDMFMDIQTAFSTAFPSNPPVIRYFHGNWYIYSPTSGAGSSINITDTGMFAALSPNSSVVTTVTGVDYGYEEVGTPFTRSSHVRLPSLPTIGDVYELINIG